MFVTSSFIKAWNYNIRGYNTSFSVVTMRRVAIIFFELEVVKNLKENWKVSSKKFHTNVLIARHFMIISLFKSCAWLQQFYISLESF